MRASLSPNRDDPPARLAVLDIVRFFAFLAIVIYHSTFALWGPQGLSYVPPQAWTGQALESFGRIFAFSGFAVLFISFFLYGLRGSSRKGGLAAWLLIFAALWAVTVQPWPYWWDVYPFLVVALGFAALARRLPRPEYVAIGAASFLSIPFWRLEALLDLPVHLKHALVGVCQTRSDLGDWPLLPWLAYPIFALSLGRLAQAHRPRLATLSRVELSLWLAAGVAVTPWLGKYYVTPLGEEFGCFVFRQPPLYFWAQHLPLLFAVRLSLVSRIEARLGAQRLVNWLSRRPVNRAFFIVYFAHYPLTHLAAAALNRAQLGFHPLTLTAAVAFVLLTLEAAGVVFSRALKHNETGEWIWPRINAK